jgi:formyltetrahydrofolate-dependent phosphoribosylglycinamide formyltransferase
MPARLVVLASGSGSNLDAVLTGCRDSTIDGAVVGVVSNVATAFALERATRAGVPSVVVERREGEARRTYDARLADIVGDFRPDWVVLAGWMRILTSEFLDHFPHRVVNLHPAMPGELPGINAIERAWDEAIAGERSQSGVMVHLVPDEGVDDGPVLASRVVPVDVSGTLEAFAASVHDTEHELLVETLAALCASDRS